LNVPLLIGCCACWVEVLPLPMVELVDPDPLPMVELPEPVLGVIVLLPVPLLVPLLPLVWACAVEKASAVPAVRRATVRRRENIKSSIMRFPQP
jgi:xanthine/uracil permease